MISILCNYCVYPKEIDISPDNICEYNENFCEYYFCHRAFKEYLKQIENESENSATENNITIKDLFKEKSYD